MSSSLERVAEDYLVAKKLSDRPRKEYRSTATKWLSWGQGVNVDQIERQHIREFLDGVHAKSPQDGGANAGRTANKARENLRPFMSWTWEQDYVEKLPRFSQPEPQRDMAGRHYLAKADPHALYFATTRHSAHRDPMAFKAILLLPQPTAFNALLHGFDGESPRRRRKFGKS